MAELLSLQDRHFTDLILEYLTWYKQEYLKNQASDSNTQSDTLKPSKVNYDARDFFEMRTIALSDKKAITTFIRDHENSFSTEDTTLIKRMEHTVSGRFILISVKKDSIHLLHTTSDDMYLLQVTPWSHEAIMNFKSFPLPLFIEAALFPSEGKIIYDMLNVLGISIGPNMGKNLKADAEVAKAKYGIITTLPIPVSKENQDILNLRGMMTNKNSIINNWDEIKDIICRNPEILTEYFQKLGAAYIRMKRKDLKNNEIYGWFALYGWTVIAGGKTRTMTETAVQSLLTTDKYDRVVYFEVKK